MIPDTIRIVHVFGSLGTEGVVGGAERAALDLLEELERSGRYECRVAVIGPPDPEWRSPLPDGRVEYLHCPYRLGLGVHIPQAAARLQHRLRELRPTLLHSHLWLADMVAGLAARAVGVPHVAHLHDTRLWMSSGHPSCRLRRWLYRRILRRAGSRFVACAAAVKGYAQRHLGLPPERVAVIRYGIRAERWQPRRVPAGEGAVRVIGCAGRLVWEKGQDLLIRAVARLAAQGLELHLRLAGGARKTGERFARLAEELGIARRVEFLGRVRDMRAFYDSIDLYVLPSRSSEGLPVSVLEAMAMARPVVVTDVAGAREEVDDGVEGKVVPPGDEEALALAIRDLAADPTAAARMGQRGRERVRRDFTVERMAADMDRFYRSYVGIG